MPFSSPYATPVPPPVWQEGRRIRTQRWHQEIRVLGKRGTPQTALKPSFPKNQLSPTEKLPTPPYGKGWRGMLGTGRLCSQASAVGQCVNRSSVLKRRASTVCLLRILRFSLEPRCSGLPEAAHDAFHLSREAKFGEPGGAGVSLRLPEGGVSGKAFRVAYPCMGGDGETQRRVRAP